MTTFLILRGAWYHLQLPVRMFYWRRQSLRMIHQHAWRPCLDMPNDIVCALYRQQLWTTPWGYTADETAVRSSIAFEIVERVHGGNAFVRGFLEDNELPIVWPQDA